MESIIATLSHVKSTYLSGLIGGVSLSNPQTLFLLLIAAAFLLYGLSAGRTRSLLSLLGIFIAFTLYRLFPFESWVQGVAGSTFPAYGVRMGIFLIFYVVVFTVLNSSGVHHRMASSELSFPFLVLVTVLQLGFLISIFAFIMPPDTGERALGGMYWYFATQNALFWWALAAFLVLVFRRRG